MAGCSNHSCVIEKPKGQGTTGGCHCLDPLGKEDARALKKKLWLMQETIDVQQEIIVAYRIGKTSLSERVFETLRKARDAGLIV